MILLTVICMFIVIFYKSPRYYGLSANTKEISNSKVVPPFLLLTNILDMFVLNIFVSDNLI